MRRSASALFLLALVALACSCPWFDPTGTQLPLWGDRRCSVPVLPMGFVPEECCTPHDNAYGVGGTELDRLVADAELLRCIALRDVPQWRAELVYDAVREYGESSWTYREHRTRGPPR